MTTLQNKAGDSKKQASPATRNLETQMPLSEKDEVKKAEQRTNKSAKKK